MKNQFLNNVLKIKKRKSAIDYDDGIRRIGNNPEVFDKVLLLYYEESVNIARTIVEAVDLEDFDAASNIVHKLKGSSGNIGAKELYQISIEFQTALKSSNQSQIHQILPVLLQQLERVQLELRKRLNPL